MSSIDKQNLIYDIQKIIIEEFINYNTNILINKITCGVNYFIVIITSCKRSNTLLTLTHE